MLLTRNRFVDKVAIIMIVSSFVGRQNEDSHSTISRVWNCLKLKEVEESFTCNISRHSIRGRERGRQERGQLECEGQFHDSSTEFEGCLNDGARYYNPQTVKECLLFKA